MATESNEAVLFEGLFEQAKLYRAQRDALVLAAEAALPWVGKAPHGVQPEYEHAYAALRAAVQAAKGGAK